MTTRLNPFSPGPATRPAHIVDRPVERESIEKALNRINAVRDENGFVPNASSPQVIVGPRGVGKTLLLLSCMKWAHKADILAKSTDQTSLTSSEQSMFSSITTQHRLGRFHEKLEREEVSARIAKKYNFEKDPSGKLIPMDLQATMVATSIVGPTAICLDEAHTVPHDRMRLLCDTAMSLMENRLPITLILAGTPGLLSLLTDMGGKFCERAKVLNFNLFTEDQTREALLKGFESTGTRVDDDALDCLVEWSEHYPYFIQLAGKEAWDRAIDGAVDTITLEHAQAGLKDAEEARYYP